LTFVAILAVFSGHFGGGVQDFCVQSLLIGLWGCIWTLLSLFSQNALGDSTWHATHPTSNATHHIFCLLLLLLFVLGFQNFNTRTPVSNTSGAS
jgi:hypothetical protein